MQANLTYSYTPNCLDLLAPNCLLAAYIVHDDALPSPLACCGSCCICTGHSRTQPPALLHLLANEHPPMGWVLFSTVRVLSNLQMTVPCACLLQFLCSSVSL
jgi:hypothetical protein